MTGVKKVEEFLLEYMVSRCLLSMELGVLDLIDGVTIMNCKLKSTSLDLNYQVFSCPNPRGMGGCLLLVTERGLR